MFAYEEPTFYLCGTMYRPLLPAFIKLRFHIASCFNFTNRRHDRKEAEAIAAAEKFNDLEDECTQATQRKLLNESKEATRKLKQYKADIVTGLLQCKIKSIIPPLLADHVLREANHYLRIMSENPKDGVAIASKMEPTAGLIHNDAK